MRLFTNYLFLSGGEAISKVVTFTAVAYLARVLGPVGFGHVEFAGAVLLCAGLIVEQGFGPYGAREIARAPERTRALTGEIVAIRFGLALGALAAVWVFLALLQAAPAVNQLVVVYGLSLLPTPLLLQWVFQGHNDMRLVAILQLVRQATYAAVIFLVIRPGVPLWMAALGELAGVSVAAGYGVWLYWRRFGRLWAARPDISARLLREGVPIGLSQLFWMVRMFGATVVVGVVASGPDVGYFGAAQRVLIALHAFIWLYHFNLLPSLSQAWQRREGHFEALLQGSLWRVAWVCVGVGLAWVVAAPAAMTAIYGAEFAPAGNVLQWLVVVIVAAALSGHYRFGLIAAGRQRSEMLAQAIGSAGALMLMPLGYRLAGPAGVAMALAVAEVVVWLITWWMGRGLLSLVGHLGLLVRPVFAALLLAVAMSVPGLGLVVRLATLLAGTAALALLLDASVRSQWQGSFAALRVWLRGLWARQFESAR